MLNQLSYKQRCILLAVIVFVVTIVMYLIPISNTLRAVEGYNEAQQQYEKIADAPQKIKRIEQQLAYVNNLIGGETGSTQYFQSELLSRVTNFCNKNKLVLDGFSEPILQRESTHTIERNVVTVKGSFKNLLRLVYELEQANKFGVIAGIQFNSKKNLQTKLYELSLSIHINNFTKNENS